MKQRNSTKQKPIQTSKNRHSRPLRPREPGRIGSYIKRRGLDLPAYGIEFNESITVQSFKNSAVKYQINLHRMDCTCPDFSINRRHYPTHSIERACKHLALEILSRPNGATSDLEKYLQARLNGSKRPRTTDLIADFSSGFVENWTFKMPAAYRQALDISFTETKAKDPKTGKLETFKVWTQGNCFSFKEGDIVYDSVDGYQIWSEALNRIKFCIQVIKASSDIENGPVDKIDGSVTFCLYISNGTNLVKHDTYCCSQSEFVMFLKNGAALDILGKRIALPTK